MATDTITNITALPTYLEAPAAAYVTQLQNVTGKLKDADLSGQYGSKFVAGQDPLQAQAQQIAQQGIGAYHFFTISGSFTRTSSSNCRCSWSICWTKCLPTIYVSIKEM